MSLLKSTAGPHKDVENIFAPVPAKTSLHILQPAQRMEKGREHGLSFAAADTLDTICTAMLHSVVSFLAILKPDDCSLAMMAKYSVLVNLISRRKRRSVTSETFLTENLGKRNMSDTRSACDVQNSVQIHCSRLMKIYMHQQLETDDR